ncbi:hypothetical protein GCM10022286_26380 [Gryllotalpicola daejeonensis]|uniref:MmpS family membrane protein n=1 Tax=Gryllotalpicola daejeonensis TaxID=993087 RepID=A0ABP7ZMF4_9MICO
MSETQSPVPPQAPVGANPPQAPQLKRRSGLGVAALVLGIIAFVLAWIPFASYVAIGLGGVGLLLGILALVLRGHRGGIAVAGTIVAGIALLAAILMTVVYAAIFSAAQSVGHDLDKKANKQVTVVFQVTGTSTDATVTYSSASGSGMSQATGQKLPFSKTITEKQGLIPVYSLTATNGTTGADIACKITVDGKVVAQQTSSGQFATVDCTATPDADK